MTAEEIAVADYYLVAGIARHGYELGRRLLTLWDGYALFEATWEPMPAFVDPELAINTFFLSDVVENNDSQLQSGAETLSQHKKKE